MSSAASSSKNVIDNISNQARGAVEMPDKRKSLGGPSSTHTVPWPTIIASQERPESTISDSGTKNLERGEKDHIAPARRALSVTFESMPQTQHRLNRTQSMPLSPDVEPQPRPRFSTPQVRKAPLNVPEYASYQRPMHFSRSNSVPRYLRSHSRHHSQSSPNSPHLTARQRKILEESSELFVAHDPFNLDADLNQKEENITFDDIDVNSVEGYWDEDELYRNPWPAVQQSWSHKQNPWVQQPVSSASSVPSSWGQLYSPFIEYPSSPPYATYPSLEPLWGDPSKPSPGPSEWTYSNAEPDSLTSTPQHPSHEPNDEETSPVRFPSTHAPPPSPRNSPIIKQSTPQEPRVDEVTTHPPFPEPVPGVFVHEGGQHQHLQGPVGYTLHSAEKRLVGASKESHEDAVYAPNDTHDQIEEPVTANPMEMSSFYARFKAFFRWPFSRRKSDTTSTFALPFYNPHNPPNRNRRPPRKFADTAVILIRTIPHQAYRHVLFRLPSLYYTRVVRIFEEAELTLHEIKKMALESGLTARGKVDVPPQYTKLKSTWDAFIDSVMREWKTFNIISALLLSAILTILQIQSAIQDPITRYTAISSLICSLVSLLFGCTYIIRFGTMRKTYQAAEWALEAKQKRTTVYWNVWVLLAMPAIWLTWSIILYIICIMSFVWHASVDSEQNPPSQLSDQNLLVIRVLMSTVLGLGILYGALILHTFRQYGQKMDDTWKRRINEWILEKGRRTQRNLNRQPSLSDSMYHNNGPAAEAHNFYPYSMPTATRTLAPFGSMYRSQTPHDDFSSLPNAGSIQPVQFPVETLDPLAVGLLPNLPKSPFPSTFTSSVGYFSQDKQILFAEEDPLEPALLLSNKDRFSQDQAPPIARHGSWSSLLLQLERLHPSGELSGGMPLELASDNATPHSQSNTSQVLLSTPLDPGVALSSVPISARDPSPNRENDPPKAVGSTLTFFRGRTDEGLSPRNVRFRSPVVSTEVSQSASSLMSGGDMEGSGESVLAGLLDDGLSRRTGGEEPPEAMLAVSTLHAGDTHGEAGRAQRRRILLPDLNLKKYFGRRRS